MEVKIEKNWNEEDYRGYREYAGWIRRLPFPGLGAVSGRAPVSGGSRASADLDNRHHKTMAQRIQEIKGERTDRKAEISGKDQDHRFRRRL